MAKTKHTITPGSAGKAMSQSSGGTAKRWTVPKGRDLRAVTRDASRQVIEHYKPAIEKLRDH